ncbi:MAG TPA: hypothetical protein DEQ74_00915 [Wolbachia sp.]|uniref:hypothetical protein n=1 Tax=Wolbachia endosymbiont of Pentalonia nigronervosa TaxID=1301914 RepID=UPI000ED5F9A0|nr:hypothetical protein [Wolbachia endosymbiont of Pentalonia nigronervosa]MBD0391311.1 hypothetical protein [Wolbachia endosymbiont of Pentalonia nigronervosa]HCE59385.1 hypothetical protein [Wolbachia sp.]
MQLISYKTKEKFLLYGPYSLRAAGLSTAFFMLSLPAGILLAARFTDPAKLNNLIPKSMQFFNVRGLEYMKPQLNAWIYMGLIFATLVTAAAIYTIYKMHANSTDIGRYELQEECSIIRDNQTVQYNSKTERDAEGKETVVHYIILNRNHILDKNEDIANCVMVSKSGLRKAGLSLIENTNDQYTYLVTKCYIAGEETPLENFHQDFFQKEHKEIIMSREDVTTRAPNTKAFTDLFLNPHKKTQDPQDRSPRV